MNGDARSHDARSLLAALTTVAAAASESSRASLRRLAERARAAGLVSQATSADADPALVTAEIRDRISGDSRTSSNVLLVEDDQLTARIVVDALESANISVLTARNAAEANMLIRTRDVAIVLLDLVLPDGDGRELLLALRSAAGSRTIPVMVMTARTDAPTQCECFALGADTVLLKPVAPSVIECAVFAHLARATERRIEGRIDPLTQLLNRAAFLDALDRAVTLARRSRQPLALAMIDIDHFKSVNDNYGHGVGDEVLAATAHAVSSALRSTDLVARWGGEELCVMLPDTEAAGAIAAIEKALDTVRKLRFQAKDETFTVTFSAGVATIAETSSREELISESDRFLYAAKHAGRNRVVSSFDEGDPPRPQILLVEDDPEVAKIVARLLERRGYRVAHFESASTALPALETQHFNAAIIDLHLPTSSGFELVRAIRAVPATSKLPVMFLTGSGEEADVVKGFEVGGNDYLVKPFHPGELVARLNRLMPRR